jgi:hypothetical protein
LLQQKAFSHKVNTSENIAYPQVPFSKFKMKLCLPAALFFAVYVEGNLRGVHSPGGNMPRSLKGCGKKGTFVKH